MLLPQSRNVGSQTVMLRFCSPLQILLISMVGYAAIWSIAPLDYYYQGGSGAVLYLLVAVLLLMIGAFIGFRGWRARTKEFEINFAKAKKFAGLLALIGSIGFGLKIFERIVLRAGGQVSTSFVENRTLIEQGGSGQIAFVGSLLGSSLMLLPLLVYLLRQCGDKRKILLLYVFLSILYPIFDLVLQGSRSTLVIFIGILIALATMMRRIRLGPTRIAMLFLAAVAILWGFGYLFWVRTEQIGLDPVASMYLSGYATFVPIQNAVLAKLMTTGVSGFGGLEFAIVNAGQYITHGVYEFLYAVDNGKAAGTNGLQTFYIPAKVFSETFLSFNIEEAISAGQVRAGVYTTLFGPIYYDFGPYGGLLVSGVVGFLFGAISRRASRSGKGLIFLHLVIVGGLLYAAVVNLFVSGGGQYLLISAAIVCLVASRTKYRFITPSPVTPGYGGRHEMG